MRLSVVRRIFPSDESFSQGVLGLLQSGDVRLFDESTREVPRWRWRTMFKDGEVLQALDSFTLDITETGAAKAT